MKASDRFVVTLVLLGVVILCLGLVFCGLLTGDAILAWLSVAVSLLVGLTAMFIIFSLHEDTGFRPAVQPQQVTVNQYYLPQPAAYVAPRLVAQPVMQPCEDYIDGQAREVVPPVALLPAPRMMHKQLGSRY